METIDKCSVPSDLRPILEALAREVLRIQPPDVADFAHSFFDEFLQHRKGNPNILNDPAAYEVFRTDLQGKMFEKYRAGSPLEESAATKIQAVFKGHLVRAHPEKFGVHKKTSSSENLRELDKKQNQKRHSVGCYSSDNETAEDRAAVKIQSEIRGFLTRKHVDKMKKEDTEAATKIQANFRGFLTRKHLNEQGISPSRSHSSLRSDHSDVDEI